MAAISSNVGSADALRNLNPAGVISNTLQQDEERQTDNIIRNNLTDRPDANARANVPTTEPTANPTTQAAPGSQAAGAAQTNVVTNPADAAVRLDLSGAAQQQTAATETDGIERFPGEFDLAAGDDSVDGAAITTAGGLDNSTAIRGFSEAEAAGEAGAANLGAAENDDLLPGQSAAPRGTNLDIVA